MLVCLPENMIDMLNILLNDKKQIVLHERLEYSLPAWYPDYSHPLVCKLAQRRNYRWSEHLIFQVFEDDVPVRNILVKVPKRHSEGMRQQEINFHPEDRARLEYRALASLYAHLEGKKNGVVAVRPLAYYADMDALVLEHWPGKNFLKIVKRAGAFYGKSSDQNVAVHVAFDAGRLLAYLHQIPSGPFPKAQPLDKLFVTSDLNVKAERLLSLHPSSLIEKQIAKVKCLINGYLEQKQVEVVTTRLHGDYYPENIVFFPPAGVFTVDTPLYQVGSIEQDIAKFLVGIATTKRHLLYGTVGMDYTVVSNVNQAFLRGYQSIGNYDYRVLLIFQFLGMLQRWIEVLEVLKNSMPQKVSFVLNQTRITPSMLESIAALQKTMQLEM